MGLCKCPKKRVTQHFCFEHRLNVCEFCMITAHPNCIVQPYLQWLEDSTFKSKCSLCQLNLSNEECIRLLCYHVFHWSCLNKYGENFPPNTAPAGFTCPDCRGPIFPTNNSPSPIFVVLKKRLSSCEWARIGLGLPVLGTSSSSSSSSPSHHHHQQQQQSNVMHSTNLTTTSTIGQTAAPSTTSITDMHASLNSNVNITNHVKIHHTPNHTSQNSGIPISVNQVSNYINLGAIDSQTNSTTLYDDSSNLYPNYSRRQLDSATGGGVYSSSDSRPLLVDIDEDKYRQKSTLEKAHRYLRNTNFLNRRYYGVRRWAFLCLAVFLAMIVLFYMLARLGREVTENDPLLDPRFNPNIHNQDADAFR